MFWVPIIFTAVKEPSSIKAFLIISSTIHTIATTELLNNSWAPHISTSLNVTRKALWLAALAFNCQLIFHNLSFSPSQMSIVLSNSYPHFTVLRATFPLFLKPAGTFSSIRIPFRFTSGISVHKCTTISCQVLSGGWWRSSLPTEQQGIQLQNLFLAPGFSNQFWHQLSWTKFPGSRLWAREKHVGTVLQIALKINIYGEKRESLKGSLNKTSVDSLGSSESGMTYRVGQYWGMGPGTEFPH